MRCHIVLTHCQKGAAYPAYRKGQLGGRTDCMQINKGGVSRLIRVPVARLRRFFHALALSRRSALITRHLLDRVGGHLAFLSSMNLNCLALGQLDGSLSKNRDRQVGLTASLKDDLMNSLCVLSRPDVNLRDHSAAHLVGILHRLRRLKGAMMMIRRSRRVVHTTSCVVSVNPGTKQLNKRIICRNSVGSLRGKDSDCAIGCLLKRRAVSLPTDRHP